MISRNPNFTELDAADTVVLETVCPFCCKKHKLVLKGDKTAKYKQGKVAPMKQATESKLHSLLSMQMKESSSSLEFATSAGAAGDSLSFGASSLSISS